MKTFRSLLRLLPLMVAGGWLACLPTGFAAPGGAPGSGTAGSAGASGGHAVSAAPTGGGHSAHVSFGFAARPAISNAGISRSPVSIGSAAGVTMGPRANALQTGLARLSFQMPTVRNAWTDPSNPRVSGGMNTASRQSNARVGNNLYPGAYGYMPTRSANGHFPHGPNGDYGGNHHRRDYYNSFPYAVYYPYLYSNYGYGGIGGYGSYGGSADYSGLTTENNVADLGAPDFTNTPNNYYSYVEPDQNRAKANAGSTPDQRLPDAPDVGPQSPAPNDKSMTTSPGPDSLVEAVQDELSRRGYFAGKADSMYGPATKEAIRRFQTDQRLPASGLINEATLHALHLD